MRENECTFRVLPAETVVNTQQVTAYGTRTKNEEEPQDGAEVFVYQYDQDLDTLNSDQLANTFQSIAKGIRSVLDMRAWLVNNPGSSLISWDRMHRSSLALLNWIVASNRSFIVQDDAVPSTDGSVLPHSNPNRVEGMGNGWMQFRFAQGSREREQLFCKALESELPKDTEYPTLFAWHGSPLKNWHSIIRTGLDFDSMAHGRSYGDGVYFSRHHAVSLGYVSPMVGYDSATTLPICDSLLPYGTRVLTRTDLIHRLPGKTRSWLFLGQSASARLSINRRVSAIRHLTMS